MTITHDHEIKWEQSSTNGVEHFKNYLNCKSYETDSENQDGNLKR